jgi:general secretion pathway protein C
MVARVLAFIVWAVVAAGVVGWGLKLSALPLALPAQTGLARAAPLAAGDWTRVLGAAPAPLAVEQAPPPPSDRFRLLGVVAARAQVAPAQGVALIAVDGKPARALRVGAVVEGEQVVQAVHARAVEIGPRHGAAAFTLELPPMPPPTTGVPAALPPPGVPQPAPRAPAVALPQALPAPPAAAEPAAAEVETAPRYGRPQQR